jgi:hypothetical protein
MLNLLIKDESFNSRFSFYKKFGSSIFIESAWLSAIELFFEDYLSFIASLAYFRVIIKIYFCT